ncbi:flagellin [Paeniglutamicibacter sp. ABSL32-1]|jgi:flagellin|uniref:flagellin N-terminal helical domain-containing protein n=1 Tax=Paeniglutamicibacter TaxID=1742990 RepID=UPI001C2D9C6F|nr:MULTISPECIES: flagellin [Paeniglutamicibacter]MBV1779998.1 flagellin [Paeniglutamicibacter quisquiliarum]MDO2935571.1 flagellin [Paeniglutamicibacter sulfureus]
MGMQINTNIAALNAHRNLTSTQNDLSKSLEKLSSGLRINRAADDAAGLAISEGLRSQVNGLTVAARNAQDGISVIQTAEGALTEVHSILQRMRDLAVQGGNDSNNADSRAAIKGEADALGSELSRISESTNFNGINLFQGGATAGPASLAFQVGAEGDAASQISVSLDSLATSLSGVVTMTGGTVSTAAAGFLVTDATAAQTTIEAIDVAIKNVSTSRADLGANQNRFESAINTLNVSRENLQAAESRIRDVDMASEMVSFTRSNILSQAGTAMLAQANQANQGVLQLLG